MKYLLLLFYTTISLGAAAQSVVFEREIKRSAIVEESKYKEILDMLGLNARIHYEYVMTAKAVAGASAGQFTLGIYVEPGPITGSRKMDGFDVSARLWPDSLAIQYSLDQPGGASVIGQKLDETSVRLREGIQQNLQTSVDWSRVRFSAKVLRVMFSSKQVQELAAAKTQIGRFTFVTGTLAGLPSDVKRFEKVEDPDTLDARRRDLELLETAIPDVRAMIANRPFWLSQADARTTESLIAENGLIMSELTAKLQKQSLGIQELVAAKANRLFRTARRGLALPYYRRLFALDPANDQALDRLTLLSVEAGDIDGATRLLIENAGLMQGFSHQRTVDKTGHSLEVLVLKKLKNPDPEAARPEVYRMDSLCKKFPGFKCPNLSYTKAAAPVRDTYAKLMNRARSETSLDHLDDALVTIEEALKAAQEGGLPAANQQSAQSLQRQVAERYVSKQCYQAQTAYKKGQDSLGTEYLASAASLQTRFQQKPTEMYAKLLATHGEPYVLSLAKQAGDGPAQVTARRNAGRYITVFKLDSDKKLANATAATNKQTPNNDCRRLQNEVNDLVNKGMKAERELSFIQAKTQYGKALEAARRKTECLINNAFLLEKLDQVEVPAQYQGLQAKAENHLDADRYDSAFATYAVAERLYEDNNLAQRFLIGVSIPATVRVPKYAGFALFAGERYLRLNELDSALSMALLSARNKAPKESLRTFTEVLAQRLAERDRKSGPRAEPRHLAIKYSAGEKRLKDFEKAYLKAWGIAQ